MESNNGNSSMEKVLEGETKVDDPRPMKKIRKEKAFESLKGPGAARPNARTSQVNVVHRDLRPALVLGDLMTIINNHDLP